MVRESPINQERSKSDQDVFGQEGALDMERPALTFIRLLQDAEASHDSSQLAEMFCDGTKLRRMITDHTGREGGASQADAIAFWHAYLDMFADVHSEFTRVIEVPNQAVLEWRSEGHLKNGHPFHYEGISVLELTDEGMIRGFRTYYDSAAFVATKAGVLHS